MKRLIYLPVERYKERWTEVVSGPGGMFESQLNRLGVPFIPIRLHDEVATITHGVVLDTVHRTVWGNFQTENLVKWMNDGAINPDEDIIYIEDFWHPGMEMIPYAASLAFPGKQFKIYAFCHAQSVDRYDFTYPMRDWMRPFERAWANCLTGIFCAAPELRKMLVSGGVCDYEKVKPTGTVFDAAVLYRLRPVDNRIDCANRERPKKVVWSSRWDPEKNPQFFLHLVDAVMKERQDICFEVCSGSSRRLLQAELYEAEYPRNFVVRKGLTKNEYYTCLRNSKVQFNAADQDFVSYTLLEAAAFGCAPLYPEYLTFPAALNYKQKHLYKKGDLEDAKRQLYALIDGPSEFYGFVYKKYEDSVHRMCYSMGFDVPPIPSLEVTLESALYPLISR